MGALGTVALSGDDTNVIDGRVLANLAAGDVAVLTFPNEIAKGQVGKNGNVIIALDKSGEQSDLVLEVLLGSDDDAYLNTRLELMTQSFPSFVLLTGRFTKNVGDGKGNVKKVTYVNQAGIFTKRVETKSNTAGEVQQAVAQYHIKFFNNTRVMR